MAVFSRNAVKATSTRERGIRDKELGVVSERTVNLAGTDRLTLYD
jgi:hypothetical protein